MCPATRRGACTVSMPSIFYFIREAFKGFARNFSTALGSIVTIFLSLLIIGVFLLPESKVATTGAWDWLGALMSITGMVALVWAIKRFAKDPDRWPALRLVRDLPQPLALDERPFDSLPALAVRREMIDRSVEAWVEALTDADLDSVLSYQNTSGTTFNREVYPLLIHLFNHQAHHRGQATTLLTQLGQVAAGS